MRVRRARRRAGSLIHGNDERGAGDQVAQQLEQDAVVRALGKQQMKFTRELQYRAAIVVAPGFLLARQMILQTLDVLAGGRLDEGFDDVCLDHAPGGEYFAGFAHRRLRHHRAAIAHQRHDAFMSQLLEYLPQPRPPEAEYFAQFGLHQTRLRRQAVIHDRAPDPLVYVGDIDGFAGSAARTQGLHAISGLLAFIQRVVEAHGVTGFVRVMVAAGSP